MQFLSLVVTLDLRFVGHEVMVHLSTLPMKRNGYVQSDLVSGDVQVPVGQCRLVISQVYGIEVETDQCRELQVGVVVGLVEVEG